MAKRTFSFPQLFLMTIEAVILIPFINIISICCPYKFIYPFCEKIGNFILFINPNKKIIIKKNLAVIFPQQDFSKEEYQKISAIIAGYELRIILEMIAFSKMSFQQKLSYIKINDPTYFVEACSNSFIGMTLHYGNWELLGHFFNDMLGVRLGALVERQFNPIINSYLQYLREKLHVTPIYNEISQMKPLFKFLQKGSSIALVADQTYWFDPLFVPFFKKDAAVPSGPASLAIKTKFPLYYAYTRYQKNGIYQLVVEQPVQLNTDDKTKIMSTIYKRYEQTISQDVTNWYSLGYPRWDLTRESLKEWEKNPDSSRY